MNKEKLLKIFETVKSLGYEQTYISRENKLFLQSLHPKSHEPKEKHFALEKKEQNPIKNKVTQEKISKNKEVNVKKEELASQLAEKAKIQAMNYSELVNYFSLDFNYLEHKPKIDCQWLFIMPSSPKHPKFLQGIEGELLTKIISAIKADSFQIVVINEKFLPKKDILSLGLIKLMSLIKTENNIIFGSKIFNTLFPKKDFRLSSNRKFTANTRHYFTGMSLANILSFSPQKQQKYKKEFWLGLKEFIS